MIKVKLQIINFLNDNQKIKEGKINQNIKLLQVLTKKRGYLELEIAPNIQD